MKEQNNKLEGNAFKVWWNENYLVDAIIAVTFFGLGWYMRSKII